MKRICYLLFIVVIVLLTACQSNTNVQSIDGKTVYQMLQNQENFVLVDVREQDEYDEGHIPQSILIPLGTIDEDFETKVPSKNQKIVIYCRTGRRSQEAYHKIVDLGYTDVYDLGGIQDWEYDIEK